MLVLPVISAPVTARLQVRSGLRRLRPLASQATNNQAPAIGLGWLHVFRNALLVGGSGNEAFSLRSDKVSKCV
jgi:hypothetical protein